ncbi:MAG: hypothetical protein PHS03_08085, partial [Sphaerochaeta sp.]|nr:hypothetical protein [Sphaerochaeta sp.]
MHPDMSGNKKQATPVTLSVDPFNVFNENETPISINQKMIEASKAAEGTPFAAKKTEPVAETVTPSPQPYKKPEKQDLPGMKKVKELTKRTKDDDSFPIGILISDQQWQLISSEAAKTTNPEETIHKYAAAITYAREYGMEIPVAMQNLEQLNQYQLGEPYQATRTNTQAIANSFKVSALSSDRMDLTAAFRKGDLSGKDISQLDLQIQDVERQLESLKDNVPRNWFVEWLKLGGENSVYGLEVAGHGLAVGAGTALALSAIAAASGLTFATGGLGAPVASSVIPIAMGTIVGAGTTAATAKRAFEMEQGVLYYELRKQGISKDVANYMSSTSGMITGVTEALFNQIGSAAMRQMGKVGFVGQATSKIMGRLAISGKIGVVAKGLMDYTLDAAGEFPQEWVQSVSNSLASDAAFALSDMVPPEKSIPMFQQAFEEGLQGFAVGLLMGTGTASANIAFDVQGASQLNKTAASIPSKEAFIASTKEQKPESVTKEDWDTSMDKVWTRQWADRKESTAIQSEEAAINELDSGKGQAPSGRIRRLSSGELFIQESETVTTDTQGNEHHQLFVGDPVTSQRYGYIDYTIRDNALTIEDIKIRSGYEGIRKESLLSLLKQYPGFDVAWEAKGENLEALKQEIISTNPRGPAAGLQVYDGVTNVDERLKLEKIIGESFPNLNASERSVASTLLQLRAEAKGMTTDSYMQSVSKDGVLYARGTAAELGNERAKGAVAFDTDAMAIIHAAEKADFSTFVHETFHVIRREMDQTEQLKQAMMEAATTPLFEKFIEERRSIFKGSMFDGKTAKEIAEYAKSFEETWTRQQEELAAKLWESYLTDGQASNKKLSGIFRRIAEWLGKIYSDVKRRTKLDPRIAGVFDSLLDKNSPLAKSVRAAEQKNSSVKTEPGKYRIVSLFQEAPAQGTKEYAELVKGTHSLLKDGENTLKVLYHGTDQSFSDFDPSMIGENYIESGNGFYFVDDIRTAERYAKLHAARAGNSNGYVMPVNLVMQDPHIQNSPSSIDAIEYFDDHSDEIISEAKIKGNDGVIIKGALRNLYVAFSPKQIYSASETSLLLFQEEGNPKIETDYPRRPEIDFKTYDIEKSIEQMNKWKADLKKWAASQGDMLQFGDEELVHVIHKNVIPDEKPWRSTSFIFFKEEWIPSGHSAYDTKFEALLDNVDSKNYRPDILFQEEGKTLAVLHNVSSERLIDIESLGGMPSPSIAVTRQDIDFTQFGDTTLIMDPSVAERAMVEGRLYDRDVWSPTVPRAEWKVNKKAIDKFDSKIKAMRNETNSWMGGSETFRNSDITNGLGSLVDSYKNNLSAQLTFLKEKAYDYEIKFKKPDAPAGFPIEVIEANKDYFDS